jgi:hypothetical protein
VIVAIPEITDLDSLASAIGPLTSGQIRIAAIEVPRNTPSKIIDSKALNSALLFAKCLRKVRATSKNMPHIALDQTGLVKPKDVMTIVVDSQVATANELRRKST